MSRRVLVLAPHTDDGEFACGGTIARWIEEGWDVHQVAFSAAETVLPADLPPDTLRKEIRAAADVLGLPDDRLEVRSYPVRHFPSHRQQILDDLIQLRDRFRPDVVLLPSTHDTHQDHQVLAQEGFRAFKHTTMLGYEMPWNNLTFATQGFVAIEQRHLDLKLRAIACYESQQNRPYASTEFIKSWALTRGVAGGSTYAEAYEVVRWVNR